MAETLTLKQLNLATPRELEELLAERGIEVGPRVTSPDMIQALVGGGGVINSRGQEIQLETPTPPANVVSTREEVEALAEVDRTQALEDQSVEDLRLLTREAGLPVPEGAKKKDLITVLKQAGVAPAVASELAHQAPASSASVPVSDEVPTAFEERTKAELLDLAEAHDVEVAKSAKKDEVIAALDAAGVGEDALPPKSEEASEEE